MHFQTEEIGSQMIIVKLIDDTLDFSNVGEFKKNIQETIKDNQVVMIDMSSLNFVDSSGLGAFLSILRGLNNNNAELKIYGLTRPVQALFTLVRMHRIFAIYNNREEALASL